MISSIVAAWHAHPIESSVVAISALLMVGLHDDVLRDLYKELLARVNRDRRRDVLVTLQNCLCGGRRHLTGSAAVGRDAVEARGRCALRAAIERFQQDGRYKAGAEDLEKVVVHVARETGIAILVSTLHAVHRHALTVGQAQARRGDEQPLLANLDVRAVLAIDERTFWDHQAIAGQ